MLTDFTLLAQEAESNEFKYLAILAVFVLGIGLPFYLGQFFGKRLRMADHSWKIGLILCTIILSGWVVCRTFDMETRKFNIKLGVDLKGGVILIYEVDEAATAAASDLEQTDNQDDSLGRINMAALVEAIGRRINPSGTKEIVIRPYGEQQVEIIIPEVDQREVDQIKDLISRAGVLQFRIVANLRDHDEIIDLAREMARDPAKKRGRLIYDDSGLPIGLWCGVGRDAQEMGRAFKVVVAGDTVRDATTGDIVDLSGAPRTADDPKERRAEFTRYVDGLGIKELEVLMATNDGYNVTGSHLGAVGRDVDESLRPCIRFNLKADGGGVGRFANLTTDHGPKNGFESQLGIVLDNTLLSAPSIQEPITQGRGRITGDFTPEEVDFVVNILEAGSLPVILNETPISENQINPLLGRETIQQGKMAIGISLSLVLVFILFYYRFSGAVACAALVLNLLFILALMVLIKAAFTLPGLAGLVLTVGMSVDANVLIFERIREELSRGAALRMAIRNGFGRATTTIVDANVTTLITAIVLYAIGTDQIRGFAVTLILGILMSMYTAIFCSRVVFDIAERSRWITRLGMMQILSATQIDFIGKRRFAAVCSILVIGVGIAGIGMRRADMFDIDFRGGTSVQLRLDGNVETEAVRGYIEQQFQGTDARFTVTAMNNRAGATANDSFKVVSSLEEVDELEDAIRKAFAAAGDVSLATYSLAFNDLRQVALQAPVNTQPDPESEATPKANSDPASTDSNTKETTEPETPASETSSEPAADPQPEADSESTESGETEATKETDSDSDEGAASLRPAGDQLAFAQEASDLLAQEDSPAVADEDTAEKKAETPPAAEAEVATDAEVDALGTGDSAAESTAPANESEETAAAISYQTEVDLTFRHAINAQTLTAELEDAAEQLSLPVSGPELINPKWDGQSSKPYETWKLKLAADEQQTRVILEHLQSKFANTPVWPASSKIGGQVAADMQQKAIAALVASLFGIVLYIWIRFQRVIFGLAAVVALIHDVLVTLGAIAVSAWLADALGFLLIEEFKISLPIVAALLTIIGYSLNDTIVVFDRIREVRGKSPDLTGEMINRSINQTLGRTLLTSLTTLLVVGILYAIGGDGIHGFAYSLVVGVIVGTYSSIFVASPVLLWMTGARSPRRPAKSPAAA